MRAAKSALGPINLIAVLLIFVLFGGLTAQNRADNSGESNSETPFPIGERLVYSVQWDPPWFLFFLPRMDAGEAELHLVGASEYNGKRVLKILFKAHSSGTLARLAGVKIDDEFTFLTDPDSLCTLAVTKKVREAKRKRQINVEYLQNTRQLHIREIDESTVPPKLVKDEIKGDIPECVQDPFSALYAFRKLPLKPGFSQIFTVGNDARIKEIKSLVENQETIRCPAGTFPAWRINTEALMGGLFKDGGQFRLWLSADERKIPLQFEAKVHLGRASGKLQSMQ